MGKITEVVTEDDFQDVLDSSGDKLVVADFWASWCGPCKMIGPQFEKMADEPEFDSVVFVKVDVDECGELAEEWGIQCMPTFVFIRSGEKVKVKKLKNTIDEMCGANKDKLREMISQHKN